jgi:mannobiose 2-epimerase
MEMGRVFSIVRAGYRAIGGRLGRWERRGLAPTPDERIRAQTAPGMRPSMKILLRGELETELRRLVDVWFPRSVDREHGGFLCDFNRRWRPSGAQHKMLEYQARQTTASARAAAQFPDLAFLREAALHGFRYLEEKMWDHRYGGWYRILDRNGEPLEEATKHGHGFGYAISACVACYELTRDPNCLDLAKTAFAWLEEHARDDKHGGYFVFYRQDGAPILSRDAAPRGIRDHIGTPIGFKDANTTSDLLDSFSDLYRVWPDALLRTRLEEMLHIMRDRLVVPPGLMHMYAQPDWTPLPDFVRYGQIIHSSNHLWLASEALAGAADRVTARVSKSMVDTMLRVAWDAEKGGFHFAGSTFGPINFEGTVLFVRNKSWWPQAEGMKALLAMARLYPDEADFYLERFVRQWGYVKRYLIDAKHGGWFSTGLDTNPEAAKEPKATMWKDASHETRALLACLRLLDSP